MNDATIKSKLQAVDAAYYAEYFPLKERFVGELPDIIYHYTNVHSFISIITGRSLWASRAEYLNDATEYRYGLAICEDQATKISSLSSSYSDFVKYLRTAMEITTESPFVTCFCKDGDLLSQWRAYSSHGQGLSLGFRSADLKKVEFARPENVIYDRQAQSDFFYSHIKILADAFFANEVDLSNKRSFDELVGYTGSLERCASLMKDPAFREECESRIRISDYNVKKEEPKQIKFRSKNNLIVPYVEVNLETVWPSAVHDIIIGPGPDPDIRKKNIEHFLRLNSLKNTPVKISNCQLRQ